MDEKELLKMLSSNRNEAYEHLYNEYYTPLVLFADHYVSNQDVARDLVQEVFIALLDVKTKFENLLHLKSYLYNSLRNKCLNHLRHEKIKQEFLQEELYLSDEFFEQKTIEEDVYSLLLSALDNLSPQSKEVMLLSLEGLSNADIAERLQLSVETVKSYKKSSKKKLTEYLLSRKDYPAFMLFMMLLELYHSI
ncbi:MULTISPECIES: sigma-70 family RNA polymerase sigma factor [Butyricimonas]|uniref:sigma-70 family RNA polymerase sigma factor n=1 Tax=Butyricimonas TaxID=574697 RepID=UPI001D05FCC0|nr:MULTISPECIES: sigma-70 family RNA polymerase sigma factor [Butyricimonas]MCB6974026.1 sigma-70 family RNA polymerase sigma factor [Butyricimonas synergistica]MCG4520912.1 sigma-70 family RNA polymerase sigma factor [Butyricimonas sp. DFI.6.44]